jgi:hypothetical protein
MKIFRADLHIHTVLSPCGDLDMSPGRIINEAVSKGLDIIGITDHNTTRHCSLISLMAGKEGIFVMQGAEVTTKEEVHCLAFFENNFKLELFQEYLDANLPGIMNNSAKFGDQVQVDENEIIIYEEKRLLLSAISRSFKDVEKLVHSLNGLFIPAHIDRKKNSIYSQLGFLPENMKADALEISSLHTIEHFTKSHPEIKEFPIIRSSDSHQPGTIGSAVTEFLLESPSFEEIAMALKGLNGRKIITG